MLLYAMLHLAGYDLTVEDLKNFRQWKSRTPGHPEHFHTDAVCTWPSFGAGWSALNLNLVQHRKSLSRMADLDARAVGVGHGDPIARGATAGLRSLSV